MKTTGSAEGSNPLALIAATGTGRRQVQKMLVARAVIYGTTFVGYVSVMLFCSQWISHPERPLATQGVLFLMDFSNWAPGLLLLFPLLGWDLIRESNRFNLPVERLGKQLRAVAEGHSGDDLPLQDEELWQEVTVAFNALRGEVLRLRQPLQTPPTSGPAGSPVAEVPADCCPVTHPESLHADGQAVAAGSGEAGAEDAVMKTIGDVQPTVADFDAVGTT